MKRTLGLLTLSLVLIQGTTGCSYSEDRQVYKSTYLSPKSVYAVYKPSNETAWSYDIPPQHVLVVERDTDDDTIEWATTSDAYPTSLSWELYPIDANKSKLKRNHYTGTPVDSGTIDLNGTPLVVGSTIGKPVDPASVPAERTIEEIEKEIDDDGLPEPDAPAEEAAE